MKKNIFWKVYGIIVALAICICITGAIFFWNFLSAYEKSQPKHEMERVICLFKDGDSQQLLKYVTYELSEFENDQILIEHLNQVLSDGQWEYVKSAKAYTTHMPVYIVKKDGIEVATITLEKNPEKGKFNTDKWELQSVDDILSARESYEILAPSNSTVYVNDIQLQSEYIIEKDIAIKDLSNSSQYVTVPTMVKYSVLGLLAEPKITAIGGIFNINLIQVVENGQKVIFAFESNEEFNKSQESKIIEFTKIYGKYVTNDAKFASISPYIMSSSYAYSFLNVIATTNVWYAAHSLPEFDKMSVSNYQIYTPDCYSCDVSFTLIVKTSKKTFTYPTNLKYYFVKSNNAWYIADFVIK